VRPFRRHWNWCRRPRRSGSAAHGALFRGSLHAASFWVRVACECFLNALGNLFLLFPCRILTSMGDCKFLLKEHQQSQILLFMALKTDPSPSGPFIPFRLA